MIYLLLFALIVFILLGIAIYQSKQTLKSTDILNKSLDRTDEVLEKYINKANKLEEELEKEYIKRVIQQVNYNKSHASRILGIARKTLREKMQKYDL
jgi:DNA-binding NtrC family response regulator